MCKATDSEELHLSQFRVNVLSLFTLSCSNMYVLLIRLYFFYPKVYQVVTLQVRLRPNT